MDDYAVIINGSMIHNLVNTDFGESADLITMKMVIYIIILGVVPSVITYRMEIIYGTIKKEILSRIILLFASVAVFSLILYTFSSFYFPFLRQHKNLRQYINPAYYSYSAGKYVSSIFKSSSDVFTQVGLDANIPKSDEHRELVILVVGEAARFDRFSINGYIRETNPILKTKDVISFSNVWSCGTSTADSVPCMFSIYGHDEYSRGKVRSTENALDIMQRAGVHVLWLDNNSDSKGMASRVENIDFKHPDNNPVCDVECRDEGMLPGLQSYIDGKKQGDILIVLHQMGSHGPAYYKRYPNNFERFTPTCKTNQLHNCTRAELDNTYDNTILYTDYFLGKVIDLLRSNDERFETAMFYISDHGESLGEGGFYLHGLPYSLAPDIQKHVPMIMWFGENFDEEDLNMPLLMKKLDKEYSHDNLFHTLLGIMEIETSVYDKKMDILH